MAGPETYRLEAFVSLSWTEEVGERVGVVVVSVNRTNPQLRKQDMDALREFAEYLGYESRGPILRLRIPRRGAQPDGVQQEVLTPE